MKKTIFNIIRIVVSLGLIIFLISYLDIRKIGDTATLLWNQHPFYLLLILLGGLIFMILEGYRLQQVLRVQDIHLPLPRLTRYCFMGMFFNNILPTTIGGDVAKGFYIARDSGKKSEPFVALVVVRIVGAVCLTAVAVLGIIFGFSYLPNMIPVYLVGAMVLIVSFAIIFFTRRKLAVKFLIFLKPFKNKTFRKEVIASYRLFHSHRHFPLQLRLAVLATLVIEFIYVSINFIIARGLDFNDVPFSACLIFVPLIAVSTMLPSIGGLGVREGMCVYLFSTLPGMDQDSAGAISLIMLVLVVTLALTGGIIYAISGTLRKAHPQPPEVGEWGIEDGE
ncbi:MAG: lysylphosphatidylglycerol synthase transmembrane domain-containing protein [Candidatus Auribacterota bacterium]|nr:lysylphosphatidylglycerol synthase transmembrane domain-containing protein [Candidatus Auribacterota bacterium]